MQAREAKAASTRFVRSAVQKVNARQVAAEMVGAVAV